MANAMSFQLKYSPINGAYGIGAIAGNESLGENYTTTNARDKKD